MLSYVHAVLPTWKQSGNAERLMLLKGELGGQFGCSTFIASMMVNCGFDHGDLWLSQQLIGLDQPHECCLDFPPPVLLYDVPVHCSMVLARQRAEQEAAQRAREEAAQAQAQKQEAEEMRIRQEEARKVSCAVITTA